MGRGRAGVGPGRADRYPGGRSTYHFAGRGRRTGAGGVDPGQVTASAIQPAGGLDDDRRRLEHVE